MEKIKNNISALWAMYTYHTWNYEKDPRSRTVVHMYAKNSETEHFKMGPSAESRQSHDLSNGWCEIRTWCCWRRSRRQCSAASENALRLPEHAGWIPGRSTFSSANPRCEERQENWQWHTLFYDPKWWWWWMDFVLGESSKQTSLGLAVRSIQKYGLGEPKINHICSIHWSKFSVIYTCIPEFKTYWRNQFTSNYISHRTCRHLWPGQAYRRGRDSVASTRGRGPGPRQPKPGLVWTTTPS